jgi:Tfp pilus assembly protein PilX
MAAKTRRCGTVRRERGVVLVVSLVILLAMTIIGVTSMQTVVSEEKMAGNLRDRAIAFQAAEAGLQVALSWVEDEWEKGRLRGVDKDCNAPLPPPLVHGCCTDGTGKTTCPEKTLPRIDWFEDGNGVAYTDLSIDGSSVKPLVGVSKQPRLAIEHRYVPPPDVDDSSRGKGVHFFTATAVGYGYALRKVGDESKPRAAALLQTTIPKEVW